MLRHQFSECLLKFKQRVSYCKKVDSSFLISTEAIKWRTFQHAKTLWNLNLLRQDKTKTRWYTRPFKYKINKVCFERKQIKKQIKNKRTHFAHNIDHSLTW